MSDQIRLIVISDTAAKSDSIVRVTGGKAVLFETLQTDSSPLSAWILPDCLGVCFLDPETGLEHYVRQEIACDPQKIPTVFFINEDPFQHVGREPIHIYGKWHVAWILKKTDMSEQFISQSNNIRETFLGISDNSKNGIEDGVQR